jgi:hypothetical protein
MRCRSNVAICFMQRSPPLLCRPQFAFNELMTDTPTLPPMTARRFHIASATPSHGGGQHLGRGWDETAFLVASGTCVAAISVDGALKRWKTPFDSTRSPIECKFLQNRCARLGRIARIQQWQGETDCLCAPGSTILPWSYSH